MTRPSQVLVGVVSDTHGLLRPQAMKALAGCELIVHAGDMGSPGVMQALSQIAPLRAVRGNVDREPWCDRYPRTEVVAVGGISLFILHNLAEIDIDPAAAGFRVVIFGHSHQPQMSEINGVLYLNPGSIGPRRFHYPISLARLCIEAGTPTAEIVELTA